MELGEEARTARVKEPLPVRFVSDHEFLRSVAQDLSQSISKYIPRIALPLSPYRFAAQHVFFVFLSLLLAPAGVILALTVNWTFLLLLTFPLAFLYLPWMRLKMMIGDRKRATGDEMPFFAVHAAIAQSAGLGLYQSLCSTIGAGVFKRIERGADATKRNVEVLGMGPLNAIEELGRNHPNREARDLLLGYTSEWRSGGDVTRYLNDKAGEFLRRVEHAWRRYKDDVAQISQMILTLLLVVPIVMLMVIFIAGGKAYVIGAGFAVVGIPLAIAACASVIFLVQPKDYTDYEGNPYLAFPMFSLAFVLTLLFFPLWVSVAASAGVGFLAYGFSVIIQKRRVSREEGSLPQFFRNMTEYQKLNYPIRKAIETTWRDDTYNNQFNDLLGHIVKQLKLGRQLSELDIPSRSWLTKLSFFHLGQVAESGGEMTKPMELLTDLITRVKEIKDETRSSLKIYRGLGILTPVLLTVIIGMIIGVLTSFQMPEVTTAGVGASMSQFRFTAPASFHSLSRMIVLASSVGIGFLMSYASDFTMKNTGWAALNSFLAAVLIFTLPLIGEWVGGLMGF